ncbi:uncharacterized protein LOC106642041 [Copidosoma floridanum]|uniref:uncharacterized protein LOC106642041 n=1 Tax=Copidosoma floridanum TaxID=29053 RepID=UPI0006C944CF|nr:uncharacterized protein LOC106642041 [Copidosoma floridanum]
MNSKQSLLPCQVSQDLCLPMTRVKIIVKSSPGVEVISQDCLYLMTKVTKITFKQFKEMMEAKTSESMLDSSDKSNDLINNDIDRDQIDSEDEETSRSSSSASSSESEYVKILWDVGV